MYNNHNSWLYNTAKVGNHHDGENHVGASKLSHLAVNTASTT
jgi:hypothetical protein